MFHLKDLLPKTASKFQLQGEMNAALVINRAQSVLKDIFSEHICQQIRVKKFKDGILWCAVDHSAVAQEVQLKSVAILQALNDALGLATVGQIRTYQEAQAPEEMY